MRNNTLARAELSDSSGVIRNIHYGDILTKYGAIINLDSALLPRIAKTESVEQLNCDRLQDGDIVVADTAEDTTAGKCSELRGIGTEEVVSGLHTIPLRPTKSYAPGYLAYYLNGPTFHHQLFPLMQGIKVVSISRQAMADTTMAVPSLPEQRRIGALFSALDSLITLHQRKLREHSRKPIPKRGGKDDFAECCSHAVQIVLPRLDKDV